MKRIIFSMLICGWLTGCATGGSEIREHDTELSGEVSQLESLYGRYEVTEAERLTRRVSAVEISRSSIGKPIFKFYYRDSKQVDVFSPHSCELSSGAAGIKCGKFSFPVFTSEFPYIWIAQRPDGENYPPKQSGGLLGPARQMTVLPGGYRMSFVLDYRERISDVALRKVD